MHRKKVNFDDDSGCLFWVVERQVNSVLSFFLFSPKFLQLHITFTVRNPPVKASSFL